MPWISRRDLDRLYAIIEKLTDHQTRVERVSAGLSETPARERPMLPPMPDEVRSWIESHSDASGGKAIRKRLKDEAYAAAREAQSWAPVVAMLQREGE